MSSLEDKRSLLSDIETAIRKITLTGQSYKIGSRQLTRADLNQLRQMRKDLQQEIASEEGDCSGLSGFYVAEFDGR